jgi:hypothetical protein
MEPTLDPNFVQLLTAQLNGSSSLSLKTRDLTDEKRLDYLNGDHFKDGLYWKGPGWNNDSDVLAEITKMFVCDNQIKICVRRHVAAILGRDPEFDLLEGENTLEGELVTAIASWWGKQSAHTRLKELMLMVAGIGRGNLRVYMPAKFSEQVKRKPPRTIADALRFLRFQVLTPLEAGPVVDEFDDTVGYYYTYTVKYGTSSKQRIEIHTPQMVATYDGTTGKPGNVVIEPVPNPLTSFDDFLIREFKRDDGPMIDESVIDLQNSLNAERTYMVKDSQLAGFRSVYTVNAADPLDPVTNKPTPWVFSPSTVLSIKGLASEDAQGKTSFANATVGTLVPVDPGTFFIPKINDYRDAIKGHFHQGWVADESPDSSGESQKQSRKDFDLQVMIDAGVAGMAIKWLVETVMRMAGYMARESLPKDFSCKPRLYLDVPSGDLTTFKDLLPAYKQGLVSLETLVESNPAVTDAISEIQRIQAGANQNIELALAFLQAGGPISVAMEMLRKAGVTSITPEMIRRQQEVDQGDPDIPDEPEETEPNPADPPPEVQDPPEEEDPNEN